MDFEFWRARHRNRAGGIANADQECGARAGGEIWVAGETEYGQIKPQGPCGLPRFVNRDEHEH
jgi:hypothetical protein